MSNKNVSEKEIMDLRLKHFFKRVSTMDIRWKQTPTKDFISPAVFKTEFLDQDDDGFTRKEMKKLLESGVIAEKSYTSRGSRRAVIVWTDYLQPQVTPLKTKIEKVRGWTKRLNLTNPPLWVLSALLFLTLLALLTLAPLRRAFGFSSAPNTRDVGLEGTLPNTDYRGYFDDKSSGVRCYWIKMSGQSTAISCVHL